MFENLLISLEYIVLTNCYVTSNRMDWM